MPAWITVYCGRRVGRITAKTLLAGITDGDRTAVAGVDYWTLAETYGLTEEDADAALEHLAVESTGRSFVSYDLRYRPDPKLRPVQLHRWSDRARVREEVEEVIERLEPAPAIVRRLKKTVDVIGIELGFSQLRDSQSSEGRRGRTSQELIDVESFRARGHASEASHTRASSSRTSAPATWRRRATG